MREKNWEIGNWKMRNGRQLRCLNRKKKFEKKITKTRSIIRVAHSDGRCDGRRGGGRASSVDDGSGAGDGEAIVHDATVRRIVRHIVDGLIHEFD